MVRKKIRRKSKSAEQELPYRLGPEEAKEVDRLWTQFRNWVNEDPKHHEVIKKYPKRPKEWYEG